MTRPLVIAHRGASGEFPENTALAFEQAIAQSADMIETDLHLSRDGVVVVHHDAGLERLGDPGEIGERDAAQLAALDAAPDFGERQSMPTLLDLLEQFADRIAFNLELKLGRHGPYEGIETRVIDAVEARGLRPRMLFSCFDDGVLERIRAHSPEARLAVLVSPRAPRKILQRAERVGAEAINPHVRLVTPGLVASAHEAGLAVYPYTANDVPEMRRLIDCGVDGVITNHPARLRAVVQALPEG